jgi:hypothetical protein
MKLKTLLAVAVAGAFALPLAASAGNDTLILAQSGGPSGASSTGTGATGGTPSPRTTGEPKAPAGDHSRMNNRSASGSTAMGGAADFSTADTNHDGQVSRAEWDAHFRSGSAASGGATTAPSGAVVSPSGSGKTGATAGPDSASNRTAPSSDTATSPSTSGQGKPR